MKIRLNKPIIGYQKNGDEVTERIHAEKEDVLSVVLNNKTHFVCDSVKYPGTSIVVFPSQCSEVIQEIELENEDPHADEKYYHIYEGYTKPIVDDPFYTAFESEDYN